MGAGQSEARRVVAGERERRPSEAVDDVTGFAGAGVCRPRKLSVVGIGVAVHTRAARRMVIGSLDDGLVAPFAGNLCMFSQQGIPCFSMAVGDEGRGKEVLHGVATPAVAGIAPVGECAHVEIVVAVEASGMSHGRSEPGVRVAPVARDASVRALQRERCSKVIEPGCRCPRLPVGRPVTRSAPRREAARVGVGVASFTIHENVFRKPGPTGAFSMAALARDRRVPAGQCEARPTVIES